MSDEVIAERQLLIVEDDPGLQSQMRWCFGPEVQVSTAADFESAVAAFRRERPMVVTLDLGLPPDPGGNSVGFAVLSELLKLDPATKVVVVTGREDRQSALSAIAQGAYDYYQKPLDADTLTFVVERAFRLAELERENERLSRIGKATALTGVIAGSPAMLAVCRTAERVAPSELTTLITGETGTGKEVFASAIHELSPRKGKPFIAINCAAIPETLLESELFGYERGAFTGANAQKKGRIEHANGGTLFLDEIGDMPTAVQAKMLRFLQQRTVERIGGRETIPVDVRVISATHRDLRQMIVASTFREDLYYRIAEMTIHLPPLRERASDVVLLGNALLRRFCSTNGRTALKFSAAAIAAMETWQWPGNVRELENRIKRAAIMAEGNLVQPQDLELTASGTDPTPFNLREVREYAEKTAILRALSMSDNNVAQAARMLGITRPTLYNLLSKYGISGGQ